ncbi:MAG: sigma 54-interacting transcriptional regulator [Bacteroidetes bacterium]|nr:sigma 54-interacting transcriptional regulator [Bacteroidota bacterium]
MDLEMLSQIAKTPEAYLNFSQAHQRRLKSKGSLAPLYKEVAYIDHRGQEVIKIVNNEIISKEQLKNVSFPENTTYKSETYFKDAKSSSSDICVTHLAGWYVSRLEQLEQGKTYNGVIRLCKKFKDASNNFSGIYMIALDHQHIMDFIYNDSNGESSLLENYLLGDYVYIFDDYGWIIAHPKLWDIRGVDKKGVPVNSFTEKTPEWTIDAGVLPINLFEMDWRLYDIYTNEPISSVVHRVQRGETVVSTIKSLGIVGESEGLLRTRVFSPIFYDTGDYSKYGIFGGVVIGTASENVLTKTNTFTAVIEQMSEDTKSRMILIASLISIAIVFCSFVIARNMSKSMRKLNDSLVEIGQKSYIVPDIQSPIKEITELSSGVKRLTNELMEKDQRINQDIKDLEIVNTKLAATKKELDSYWKREYEIESDSVLDEKIESYEKQYPELKEIRERICIGNSPQFLRVLRQIVPQSQMTFPSWIYGESGVGKSALASVIHMLSPRRDKTFQTFAASEFAAADPMIILGKLFGYGQGHGIRGISKNGQKGIIEQCNSGTLFIDDLDALPLETQAHLLRVLDGLSFHPAAGKLRNITADVKFLFASNVDLEQRVKEGAFRKDLFRRIGGSYIKIEIPTLRERKSDIPLLAKHFLNNYGKRFSTKLHMSDDALSVLMNHDYVEGNIAELKVLIELACENARIQGDMTLSEKHLPGLGKVKNHSIVKVAFPPNIFNEKEIRELTTLHKNKFRIKISEEELGFKQGSRTLSHHLRGICLKALAHTEWNIDEASRILTGEEKRTGYQIIIRQKIEAYIKNLTRKENSDQKKSLYKNLPKEYYSFVDQAINHYENNPQVNPTL